MHRILAFVNSHGYVCIVMYVHFITCCVKSPKPVFELHDKTIHGTIQVWDCTLQECSSNNVQEGQWNFRKYAQHWRSDADRVRLPMLKNSSYLLSSAPRKPYYDQSGYLNATLDACEEMTEKGYICERMGIFYHKMIEKILRMASNLVGYQIQKWVIVKWRE